MILLVKSYPYHFVRTILSLPLCPIPFCPYTILSVLFCPLPFCPRTVHTIAKKGSTGTTSKYSPICPKFCTQLILLCVTRAALWSHAFPTFSFLGHTNVQQNHISNSPRLSHRLTGCSPRVSGNNRMTLISRHIQQYKHNFTQVNTHRKPNNS